MEKWAIGVDLGGTKIEAVLVGGNGNLIDHLRIPTDSFKGSYEVIKRTISLIKTLQGRNPNISIDIIGIGVAGQIDKDNGSVIHAPNLKWDNVYLRELIANELIIPVLVCNDVRGAAWGEWLFGSGKGHNDLACIFVGTGVGGAFVCNGKMLDGFNNSAGEVGHLVVKVNGPRCTCGNYGCLEAIAGGWAIKKEAQLVARQDKLFAQTMVHIAGGITSITANTVALAALKGDKLANKIIDNVVEALIAGVISIINLFGPSCVILGGGIIEGMPILIQRIEEGVRKYALKAALSDIKILPAKLHSNSGAIGAAIFALNRKNRIQA